MAPTATDTKPLVVELDFEKDTKNTQRFETDEEGAAVGQLYVTKTGLAAIGNPKRIRVIVEPVD